MLPRVVRNTLVVARVARAAQFVEPLLFVLVAVEAGAGTAVAAAALLSHHLGVAAGTMAAGRLADRVGTRTVTTLGLFTAAASIAVLAVSTGPGLLISAAALYGVAAATWRLALETGIARALAIGAPSAEADESLSLRGLAFGGLVAARTVGALASGVALALGIGFGEALGVQAGLTAAAGVAALALLPSGLPVSAPAPSAAPGRVERELRLIALATVPAVLVVFQAFAGLAALYDEKTFRWMVLLNAAILVASLGFVEAAARRIGGAWLLSAATAAIAIGMAAAAVPGMPFVIPTLVWSVGELAMFAVLPAVVTGLAPAALTGRYQSRVAVAHGVAAAMATAAGPLLVEASVTGFAVAALVLGVIGAVALHTIAPAIGASLAQPVGCPCGALLCRCDEYHLACAAATPQVAVR